MNKQELNRFIDKISPTGPGGIEKIKRVLKTVLDKEGEEGVTEEELLEALAAKQDTLVSGTNIKTINNTSLLGSGDIAIPKGDKGDKGDTGPQGPQGPQGLKGDTGVSADYPITIYNGLDSDATDQALSAAQGKVLDGKVSQLESEVHNLSGKYYGVFTSSASLPDEITQPGYAFVGTEEPFSIWNFDGEEWADTGAEATAIYGQPGEDGVGFQTITTLQDGTMVITLTSGDTITINLNHNHLAYPKYQLLTDEAEYAALTTKESDTLYLIPE